QTTLLQAQIQLGEAQRSTSIVPEILAIGAAIGAETAVLATDGRPAQVFGAAEFSLSLRARIIAATNAARPYRHLVSSLAGLNEIEIVAAALKRRTDLPTTIADYETWRASQPLARSLAELGEPSSELTDREVSPERGQLISLLYNSRILDTEELSYNGADFSFAELRQPVLGAMSFRHAKLRFADFSGVEVRGTNFGGASLDHARFRGATIVETDFAGIPGADIEPPYLANPAVPVWWTLLNGADFSSSFIDRSKFGSTRAFAANFDSAYVGNSDFSNAALGASTFRNAIIDDCLFEGANMSSVDFSGAIVFDAAFLDKLAAAAASQSFVRERFALEPAPFEVVDTHPQAMNMDPAIIGGIADGSIPAFRVVRVGEFESDPGRATQAID
ncbi:MAG: pentapeptide repeat-containing protein, partial [Cucumibacter sp.]